VRLSTSERRCFAPCIEQIETGQCECTRRKLPVDDLMWFWFGILGVDWHMALMRDVHPSHVGEGWWTGRTDNMGLGLR